MALEGSLHIVRLSDPYTRSWKYLVYFAPHEGELDELPQRACDGTNELEAMLAGLGLDDLERVRVIADVQRDSARTIPNISTTPDRLRELGF
jgi:hypothetical protein